MTDKNDTGIPYTISYKITYPPPEKDVSSTMSNNVNQDKSGISNVAKCPEIGNVRFSISSDGGHGISPDHPTSFLETFMHLLRGNIGSGVFAMGDAFKSGGLLLSPVLVLILGVICVHSQHILLKCSRRVREKTNLQNNPNFAETVELCLENGPPLIRPWSKTMKLIVNFFLCVTQLGFCCIYFVFIATNVKQLFDYYEYKFDINLHKLFILLPILLPSLLTNLKVLAICSTIANVSMGFGIAVTFYFAICDAPDLSDRNYVGDLVNLPLFFGTAIYAFEGIALVLPLKNSMAKPKKFNSSFGVLNIGMIFVTLLFTFFGFFGYLKWGEDVAGSLTLNLPKDDILAQVVKGTVSFGMLLTYPLQFFVAIQIMWPFIVEKMGPFKHMLFAELTFRSIMVLVTFCIAAIVPELNLFISLIGALCSTALALVIPPVIQLILAWGTSNGPGAFLLLKNIIILIVAMAGFSTGTYESVVQLYKAFAAQY